MNLCGIDLPEPTNKNIIKAISIARKIHQNEVNKRTRNTDGQKWDKYWVTIYDLVLGQLRRNENKTKSMR